jgi:GTP cyclohydrolase I
MPTGKVVGLSKLAPGRDLRRLQTQETMTMQIADAIEDHLSAAGVAADRRRAPVHATRGVHHHDVSTITTQFRGVFKTDKVLQQRFMDLVRK